MSNDALNWAKRQRVGGLARKAVLLLLADHANKQNEVWISLRELAKEGDTDQKSIQCQLGALESLGLIAKRTGGATQRNLYTLRREVEITERPKRPPRVRVQRPQGAGTETAPNCGQVDRTVRSQRPQGGAVTETAGCGQGDQEVRSQRPPNPYRTLKPSTGGLVEDVSPDRARGPVAVAEALNATARSAEVETMIKRWSTDHEPPLPPTTYILLAKQIDQLRQQDAVPAHVWAALREWDNKRHAGEKPKPGLLRYLHDQIKLDGLTPTQMYSTPVDYLRDEDIDLFEVLGYDSMQFEAPYEIENGPMDQRRAWYDQAYATRNHQRCVEARDRIARRQQLHLLPRPA